ncbi:MAG: hypothetical protein L0Y39_10760 [Methylococcaceae bacterium]|nr:hypothetical protein [Methylococcaceae bacterium]
MPSTRQFIITLANQTPGTVKSEEKAVTLLPKIYSGQDVEIALQDELSQEEN